MYRAQFIEHETFSSRLSNSYLQYSCSIIYRELLVRKVKLREVRYNIPRDISSLTSVPHSFFQEISISRKVDYAYIHRRIERDKRRDSKHKGNMDARFRFFRVVFFTNSVINFILAKNLGREQCTLKLVGNGCCVKNFVFLRSCKSFAFEKSREKKEKDSNLLPFALMKRVRAYTVTCYTKNKASQIRLFVSQIIRFIILGIKVMLYYVIM